MKCKVIEDLLPLYIDKVCSKESSLLVEEHLKECSKCARLYEIMSEEITNSDTDYSEINNTLKEKDLLLNAKKSIKFEFFKKNLKRFYRFIAILNILFLIIVFLTIKFGYNIEYPRFSANVLSIKQYLFLSIFAILPLIFSIFNSFLLKHITISNHYKSKFIFLTMTLLLSLIIGLFSNLILFSIPPIESYTNSTNNYLIVEKDVQKHKDIFEFFPKEIPSCSTNVNYSYKKYETLLGDTIEISATWSLPSDSYDLAKKLVQDTCTIDIVSYNKYKVHLKNTNYNDSFLNLYLEYDDNSHTLTYTANYNK